MLHVDLHILCVQETASRKTNFFVVYVERQKSMLKSLFLNFYFCTTHNVSFQKTVCAHIVYEHIYAYIFSKILNLFF
jgi:hypothetical protein